MPTCQEKLHGDRSALGPLIGLREAWTRSPLVAAHRRFSVGVGGNHGGKQSSVKMLMMTVS